MKSVPWNPWHGCHKYSEGCLHCYVHYLDGLRDRDADIVTRNKGDFDAPVKTRRDGSWKIGPGAEVFTCFTSDFLLEEADAWRPEAWRIIRARPDLRFVIPTKRIVRLAECLPEDWGGGYDHVSFAVTMESQRQADLRFPVLRAAPIRHKLVFLAPLLEYIDLKPYLPGSGIEQVSVGGESYEGARLCDFEWIRRIKDDCDACGVPFHLHQTGSLFRYNGRIYRIPHRREYEQAKKAEDMLRGR